VFYPRVFLLYLFIVGDVLSFFTNNKPVQLPQDSTPVKWLLRHKGDVNCIALSGRSFILFHSPLDRGAVL